MKKYCFLIYCLLILGVGNAQYTVLHSFNDTNGNPTGDLTLVGKVLYGMTPAAGVPSYYGSIFSIDTDGSRYKILHEFNGAHGYYTQPYNSLIYAAGVLYGMTSNGGTHNYGNIFSIDTDGNNYKDLFDFDSANGVYPYGSLTFYGGTLYGMTSLGAKYGLGNIFHIDTNGSGFKDLFDIGSVPNGGNQPYGSLTLSGKVLYGMTTVGGAAYGNIFSIDTNGSNYKDLFNFSGSPGDGLNPCGNLTLSRGVLYGMTPLGGYGAGNGNIFSIDTDGTGFKDMIDFSGLYPGRNPYGSLTLSGNLLYGMTTVNIFSIDTNGSRFKILFKDFNATNGMGPSGSLTLSGSTLYGMTQGGGASNFGVIFKIDTSAVASINNLTVNKGAINIYPNPTSQQVTVKMESVKEQDIEFILYNLFGQPVYSDKVHEYQGAITKEISLSSLPSGNYILQVIAGTNVYHAKITKLQ